MSMLDRHLKLVWRVLLGRESMLTREELLEALPGAARETQRWVDLNIDPVGTVSGIGLYRWGDVLDALGARPVDPPQPTAPPPISSWRGVAKALGISEDTVARHRREYGDRTIEPWFRDVAAVQEWWQKMHEPPPLRRTGR